MPRRVRLSPQAAADKHIRRTTAAVQDMTDGVKAVTEAPTAAAVRKLDKMQARWNEAYSSGKIKRGLERVSLEDWKDSMLNKGVGRVAQGVTAARPKLEAFYGELFPFQDRLLGEIEQMNDLSLEDSIQRSAAWIRGMAGFTRG